MYNEWDIAVREIGGGIWFWTSFWLTIAFVAYVIRKSFVERNGDRVIVGAAAALTLFFAGSSLRGFITWMQFFYAGNGWDTAAWVKTWPWYGLSVLMNIAGAAACIWLLSSWRWRVIFTTCAIGGAVAVPVALRWLV